MTCGVVTEYVDADAVSDRRAERVDMKRLNAPAAVIDDSKEF